MLVPVVFTLYFTVLRLYDGGSSFTFGIGAFTTTLPHADSEQEAVWPCVGMAALGPRQYVEKNYLA